MLNMTKPPRERVMNVHLGLRMPVDLHQQLLKYALRRQMPLSRAVREVIEKGLGG